MEVSQEIKLTAAETGNQSEHWVLRCSSIFRCSTSGINPISSIENNENVISWLPFPGEKLKIAISKPEGIEGPTKTVDNVTLSYSPGPRLLNASLSLSARTSQGGWQEIRLPDTAILQGVKINNLDKFSKLENGKLSLALKPGANNINVTWRENFKPGFKSNLSGAEISDGAANVNLKLNLPAKRWVLYAKATNWGPVFLFWGELLVIILISILLGVKRIAKLGVIEWVLLGMGLASVGPVLAAIPFIWLIAFMLRDKLDLKGRFSFNLFQVILAGLSLLSAMVLYVAISDGLLGSPSMSIAGEGSGKWLLSWYTDKISSQIPTITLYSLPLWVWRTLMFLWSCWLVSSLLRWSRWAWSCYSKDGLWKTKSQLHQPA